ncbi:hypothetical protein ACA29_15240 [Lederbergia galactosidilytica]|uniref:Uncharacterized protein n=1 Tax=Lederbergia galactosidilytica TaxID=217031 RepID=A0A0Q9XU02_9BACI|nr:hypothetical protein ACA29_15240 [Lederbergia galactosidilytica]
MLFSDLDAFQFETRLAEVYETTLQKDLKRSELSIYKNGFKITLDEQSVTTIVIPNVEMK